MTAADRFERDLPMDLENLAGPHTPDYLTDILGVTAATSQRPAWTFPERWFPMADIASRPAFAPRMPLRAIGVALIIIALLAVAVAAFVGSRQTKLPPPFGPARNGLMLFGDGSDIFTIDPITNETRAIIGGPERDSEPYYSFRGDLISFLRQGPDGVLVMVARADGSHIVQAAGPFPQGITRWVWSPDGRTIAIESAINGAPGITIASTDGSPSKTLDLGMPAEWPEFRPPDGTQLTFRGWGPLNTADLYVLDLADSRVTRLEGPGLPNPGREYDFTGAAWSPDGTRIAYNAQVDRPDRDFNLRLHVADVTPEGAVTKDRELEFDPTSACECWAVWSPDGQRIMFKHVVDERVDAVIASVDGDGSFTPIGPSVPDVDGGLGFDWAPDATSVLRYDWATGAIQQFDPAGDAGAVLPIKGGLSWQRTATEP